MGVGVSVGAEYRLTVHYLLEHCVINGGQLSPLIHVSSLPGSFGLLFPVGTRKNHNR